MQEEVQTLTSQDSAQLKGRPVTVCSPRLVKGMSEEEAQTFDKSYRRAKTVLSKINAYARSEYLKILREEENIQALNIPNYSEYIADRCAARRVWAELQELTRTK